MSEPLASAALRCPDCRGEAYLCERPLHGMATWAFHCRSFPSHNRFGAVGDGGPPPEWTHSRVVPAEDSAPPWVRETGYFIAGEVPNGE